MPISETQVDCWADEMVFAIGEWLQPIDVSEREAALAKAVRSEIKRIIAEATLLAEQKQ